ncbi:hypothetical protein [Amycolatopsis acidicola]|uniref:hypothetical protein n=1 Tax=Amycolatopsis acidicola TaxID=2596893 RepID=UPI001409C319|nr:hypothetical protein [Amycolatopsis acidicola]
MVVTNMLITFGAFQSTRNQNGEQAVQLQQLSDQASACVQSGNTSSYECQQAKAKASDAKDTVSPATTVVTVPGGSTTVISQVPAATVTETVPLPLPVTSVLEVAGPVSSASPSTVTDSKTVTQTETAAPSTETVTVTQQPSTETQTSTSTETSTVTCTQSILGGAC